MRRPKPTPKQRDYNRQQRALLRLRRAAVRYSENDGTLGTHSDMLADLEAACDAYTTSLNKRELRRLVK